MWFLPRNRLLVIQEMTIITRVMAVVSNNCKTVEFTVICVMRSRRKCVIYITIVIMITKSDNDDVDDGDGNSR